MIKTHSRERFTKSALISAVLHITALAVLFSKPLHFTPKFLSQIGKTPSVFLEEENIVILKRNLALEEAMSYLETPPLHVSQTYSKELTLQDLESSFESPLQLPPINLSLPDFVQPPLPDLEVPHFIEPSASLKKLQPIATIHPEITLKSDPLQEGDFDYKAPLPALPALKDEASIAFVYIPSEEQSKSLSHSAPEMPVPEMLDQMTPSIPAPALSETPNEQIAKVYADFTISPSSPKSIVGVRSFSSLGDYGLPILELREWNEFFDADVKTFAKEEGGFLFSIQIIPRVDLSEHRLKQNYLFVIDRSSSADKAHFQTAKRGINRAVSALRPGDFFNILILDASITRLNEIPLAVTKANIQKAEEFLNKQSHSYHGAAADVYTTLTKILNSQIAADEAVTAILISDGDSPLKSTQQRKKINTWLEANRDRVTLYTATAGHGNNLSSLKMLSLASRGSLLYSDTHASFPRKLAKLVMDLRYPIAKEMTLAVIPQDADSHIEILPPASRLPNLFSDHPYVLVGSAEKLSDFTLLLEGKNKDQIFKIKKTISLSKAKQGSRLLQKQWAAEKAHTLFDQYLREGEATVLKQAENQLGHDTKNSRR